MDFVDEKDRKTSEEVQPESAVATAPKESKPYSKTATICGDCTVVEDAPPPDVSPVDRLVIPADIASFGPDDTVIHIIGKFTHSMKYCWVIIFSLLLLQELLLPSICVSLIGTFIHI